MLPRKLLSSVCFLLLTFCVGALPAAAEEETGAGPSRPSADNLLEIGQVAPEIPADAWVGPAAPLAGSRGKITLLYFLEPGCATCDNFSPHLQRLAMRHEGELATVGIAADNRTDLEIFNAKKIGDYKIVEDLSRRVANRYIGLISKLPLVALLDREGKFIWLGRAKFQDQIAEEARRAVTGEAPAWTARHLPAHAAGKRYALVVGVAGRAAGQAELAAPRNDARAVAKLLREKLGYEVSEMIDLPGAEAAHQPTAANIQAEVQRLAKLAGAEDSLVFYFSGEGRAWPTPTSGDLLLKPGDFYSASAGLQLSRVRDWLAAGSCPRRLAIVDIGHEDGDEPHLEDIAEALEKGLGGLPLLLSAARFDLSRLSPAEDGANRRSLFSQYLEAGLGGAADYDHDGAVIQPELFRYIRDRLIDWSRRHGPLQSPFLIGAQAAGQHVGFILAPAKP